MKTDMRDLTTAQIACAPFLSLSLFLPPLYREENQQINVPLIPTGFRH